MKWTVGILFFAIAVLAQDWRPGQPVNSVEPEKSPFWQRKEKYRTRVYNDRTVVVLVQSRPTPTSVAGFPRELFMQGAGLTNAPLDFTYQTAKRFDDYPKMSSYVKSAHYDPKAGYLFMHTSAYGYDAHLKMQMEFRETDHLQKEIRFRVVEGVFKNLNGVVRLAKVSEKGTLISLTAQQGYHQLPIPKFFVEFGIEFALQKMASRMRGFVEESFQKGLK